MGTWRQSMEAEPGGPFGAALTPVRWLVLLGIVASLHLPFGREIPIYRVGVLAAVAVYAATIAGLPRLNGRPLRRDTLERLLLAADLWFSAAVFPLVIWAAGRLAQEVRHRELSLHQAERRALTLEANVTLLRPG